MSNGWSGCGTAAAQFDRPGHDERKGRVAVTSCWSSSDSWVELTCTPDDDEKDQFTVYVDQDSSAAAELTWALLQAIGQTEMAEALYDKAVHCAEKEAARERAESEWAASHDAAEAAFRNATTAERAKFAAAIDRLERAYEEATGTRMIATRSVELAPLPAEADVLPS